MYLLALSDLTRDLMNRAGAKAANLGELLRAGFPVPDGFVLTTEAFGRFLLHAGRCIVFHNEKPSAVPFPSWLDPAWHNCLVGCLLCQGKCPENRDFAGACQEGATFSPGETELLLAGTSLDRMPAPLAKKLEAFDLASLLEVLPRNLKALIERAK